MSKVKFRYHIMALVSAIAVAFIASTITQNEAITTFAFLVALAADMISSEWTIQDVAAKGHKDIVRED